jgi:hypothetical protein
MKKTYINPEMTVVKIKPRRILTGSLNMIDSPSTAVTPGTTLSREFDDIDDFDE